MNKIITIYELLGLVKDGKAPKKIKYEDIIWKYDLQENEYIKDGDYWLFQDYFPNNLNFLDCLNDKVEILEEDKPMIEKIDGGIITSRGAYTNLNDVYKDMSTSYETIDDIIIKINEIIDYINRKEDK